MDKQKKTANLVKKSKNTKKHTKIIKIIVISAMILIFSSLCMFFDTINPCLINWLKDDFSIVTSRNEMLVHFIDVGQGDAIAINLPDGKVALIDTGSTNATYDYAKYLKEKVMNGKHDNLIDYLILTHADADHIGGAIKLTKLYDFEIIFMPIVDSTTETYLTLKQLVEQENCTIKSYTDLIEIENDYVLTIFNSIDWDDSNNSCPLIKLEYKNKSFLFAGDLEADAERIYTNIYGDLLDVDVLKVAHHGSKYSSCDEYLSVVTPEFAIISSGNMYGHPNDETLERLNNVNAEIIRTDTVGNIMFVLGKDYTLDVLTGDYFVSSFVFDYRYIILIFNSVLVIEIVVILIKKENKHKKY